MEFSKFIESATKALDIWQAFTKNRGKAKQEVDNISMQNGWSFPGDIEILITEIRLMGNDSRLLEIAGELSLAVGKPHEAVFSQKVEGLFKYAERVEFLYSGERKPNQATPDTMKRACFFCYDDNDDEVNKLNMRLSELWSVLNCSLLNLNDVCSTMFAEKPKKKVKYKCGNVDIVEDIRVFFWRQKAHNLSKARFLKAVLNADFSGIYDSIQGNKAKVKYLICCLSPLFPSDWYRDSAGSIGFPPRECSSATVSDPIKHGWSSTKTAQLMTKKADRKK